MPSVGLKFMTLRLGVTLYAQRAYYMDTCAAIYSSRMTEYTSRLLITLFL